jgi:hypothetical protein
MLIDKGISSGEVISFKLNSGEELIAKLEEETATSYKVSKPLVLSMSNQGIGMVPFMFTANADKDITVNKTSIAAVTVCDKMFADQYIQGTTGIKLA